MSKVTLLLYDLTQGMARAMSMMIIGQQVDAVYHSSIVAFGKEYFYGGGICTSAIEQTPYGKPVERVDMGVTEVDQETFDLFLSEVQNRYSPDKYDLITHNCNHFTDEACQFLVGRPIPQKVSKQAETLLNTPAGQMIKPFLANMQGAVQNPQPGMYQ